MDKRSQERDDDADIRDSIRDDEPTGSAADEDAPANTEPWRYTRSPGAGSGYRYEGARFGPIDRRVPSSRWVTVALCLIFVALLVYAISTGNVVSVVGMVVIIVFVGLPLLVLTIVNHGRFLPPPPPPTPYDTLAKDDAYARDAQDERDEREPLDGHYPAHLLDEPPDDDGARHGLN